MSPTHQDLSNDTTFSQIKSRVPVPLSESKQKRPQINFYINKNTPLYVLCWQDCKKVVFFFVPKEWEL